MFSFKLCRAYSMLKWFGLVQAKRLNEEQANRKCKRKIKRERHKTEMAREREKQKQIQQNNNEEDKNRPTAAVI